MPHSPQQVLACEVGALQMSQKRTLARQDFRGVGQTASGGNKPLHLGQTVCGMTT
jgi:hypothetical protein